jgi:hypothetical protein
MAKFVKHLLPSSIKYLHQQHQDPLSRSKLLYFLQLLYKATEWAIGVDDQLVAEAIPLDQSEALLKLICEGSFSSLPLISSVDSASLEQAILGNPLVRFNFLHIEERRLAAKVLTIISRDHLQLRHRIKRNSVELGNVVFRLAIQNLIAIQPAFMFWANSVNKDNFDDLLAASQPYSLLYDLQSVSSSFVNPRIYEVIFNAQVDFEEFDGEIKALVTQLINLIQTLMLEDHS